MKWNMVRMALGIAGVLMLLAAGMASVGAQTGDWWVYLYDNENQQLLRVDRQGATQAFDFAGADLVPGAGYFVPPTGYSLAISPDGDFAAWCVPGTEADQPPWTLVARELATMTDVWTRDLGPALHCRAGAWSPDGARLAVALVRWVHGEMGAAEGMPPWELHLLDAATGEDLHVLDTESPEAASAPVAAPIYPYVLRVTADTVIYRESMWRWPEPYEPRVLAWFPAAGTLEEVTTGWNNTSVAALGDELIYTTYDPTWNAADSGGPTPPINTLRAVDHTGADRLIYTTADWLLGAVSFVDAGRSLGVRLDPPYNPDVPMPATRWLLLDRAGNRAELPYDGTLINAPEGFGLFEPVRASNGLIIGARLHAGTGPDDLTVLWESDVFGWVLVGSAPVAPAEDFPPFDESLDSLG